MFKLEQVTPYSSLFVFGLLSFLRLINKSKIQEEARFQILRILHEDPNLTQRELGEKVGVSLGAVNYCLRALIDLGLVKVINFSRNPNKFGYAYALTPSGIAQKAALTRSFLQTKMTEFEALRAEIEVLSREAGEPGRADT